MDRSAWGWQWSGARRQLSEVTMRNMTEAVDIIPNLVVCKGKKDGVSQSQEEDEAALPRPTKKRVRHLRLATDQVSSSPHRPDRRQLALLRSTAKAGQQLSASLEQAVSSSPPAASWETPLLCREDRCRQLHPPIFEDVTYEVEHELDGASSESDSSNGAFVIIRWFCHHCGTSSSQRVRH